MGLNLEMVGVESGPFEYSWTPKDVMLYALGLGAGVDELAFTTENTEGVELRVLPSYAVLACSVPGLFDQIGASAGILHAEQSFELKQELPASGDVRITAKVTDVYDKGSGALIIAESTAVDASTGDVLIVARSGGFDREAGGFGGDRGPKSWWQRPDRPADHTVEFQTGRDQALLYRLSGDRNPLHSDPAFASANGYPKPILHGMCTYGIAGRALLHAVAKSDPARFHGMYGRFSAPVLPGDALTVSIWEESGDVLFTTLKGDGTVVIDHGRATIDPD